MVSSKKKDNSATSGFKSYLKKLLFILIWNLLIFSAGYYVGHKHPEWIYYEYWFKSNETVKTIDVPLGKETETDDEQINEVIKKAIDDNNIDKNKTIKPNEQQNKLSKKEKDKDIKKKALTKQPEKVETSKEKEKHKEDKDKKNKKISEKEKIETVKQTKQDEKNIQKNNTKQQSAETQQKKANDKIIDKDKTKKQNDIIKDKIIETAE